MFTTWVTLLSAAESNKQDIIENPSRHTKNIDVVLNKLVDTLPNRYCISLEEGERDIVHSALQSYKKAFSSSNEADHQKMSGLLDILNNGRPSRHNENVDIIIYTLLRNLSLGIACPDRSNKSTAALYSIIDLYVKKYFDRTISHIEYAAFLRDLEWLIESNSSAPDDGYVAALIAVLNIYCRASSAVSN